MLGSRRWRPGDCEGLAFGHLPDRFGGAKVALGCVVVEAIGLAIMWLASSGGLAAVGAALTGFGYFLLVPGLEAVRLAGPESRGVAMGAYPACPISRSASPARASGLWPGGRTAWMAKDVYPCQEKS